MAELYNITFEAGGVPTDYFGTLSGTAHTISGDAAKLGVYGLDADSNTDGYVKEEFDPWPETDDLYVGFHLYIDGDMRISQYGDFNLFRIQIVQEDDETTANHVLWCHQENSASAAPTEWRQYGIFGNWTGGTIVTDEWLWMVLHFKLGSTGGVVLYVNDAEIHDTANVDLSAYYKFVYFQFDYSGDWDTYAPVYIDNVIINTSEYPTEPASSEWTTHTHSTIVFS